MHLRDLKIGQKLIVQILWGEREMEFSSQVESYSDTGVIILPYIHFDVPMELTVDGRGNMICHMYSDDEATGARVSWKNVCLESRTWEDKVRYVITTSTFNQESKVDDRRQNNRVVVHKPGKMLDDQENTVDIMIHDISDSGISFYAPAKFAVPVNKSRLWFMAQVGKVSYEIKVECRVVRTVPKIGMNFYGCTIAEANNELMIYMLARKREDRQDTDS